MTFMNYHDHNQRKQCDHISNRVNCSFRMTKSFIYNSKGVKLHCVRMHVQYTYRTIHTIQIENTGDKYQKEI